MNKLLLISAMTIAFVLGTTSCLKGKKSDKGTENDSITVNKQEIAQNQWDTVPLKLFTLEKNIPLIDKQKLPAANIKMNIYYPDYFKNDTTSEKLQQLFSQSVFGPDLGMFTFTEAENLFTQKYIDDYFQLRKEYRKEILNSKNKNVSWMNYEYICNTTINLNRDTLFGYNVLSYTYTGGAHGMTSSTYNIIDLTTMKEVMLDDIINNSAKDKISQFLVEQLKIDKKATSRQLSLQGYELSAIAPTENFYIADNKIIWVYNQYEIAPYSMGVIKIGLSFSKLKPYLKKNNPIQRLIK